MTIIQGKELASNAANAASLTHNYTLGLPSARQFPILTCMDTTLDPSRPALPDGGAHPIPISEDCASDAEILDCVV